MVTFNSLLFELTRLILAHFIHRGTALSSLGTRPRLAPPLPPSRPKKLNICTLESNYPSKFVHERSKYTKVNRPATLMSTDADGEASPYPPLYGGAENAGSENAGPKMQGWKMRN